MIDQPTIHPLESLANKTTNETARVIKQNILFRRLNSAVRSQLLNAKQLLDKSNADLKELREQKPYKWFNPESKNSVIGHDSKVMHGNEFLFDDWSEPLYKYPVAQSRDIAEPDVRDIGNELHNIATRIHYTGDENLADELGAIALRLWKLSQSNANDHIEPAQGEAIPMFQAACSGLWYRDPMACGEVSAITVGARHYKLPVIEQSPAEPEQQVQGEPDAWVPVHPVNGPLWASAITNLDSDRPNHYPLIPVFIQQSPAVAVPDDWREALEYVSSILADVPDVLSIFPGPKETILLMDVKKIINKLLSLASQVSAALKCCCGETDMSWTICPDHGRENKSAQDEGKV